MKLYELTYIITPGLSEEEQKKLAEKVASFLQNSPTEQNSSGFLNSLTFNSDPEKIKELDASLKETSQIKKYIIVKKEFSRVRIRAPRKLENKEKEEKTTDKPKVELKEIEKKLDEILKD